MIFTRPFCDPADRWGVVAEERDVFVAEILRRALHAQPEEQVSCHFEVGVRDFAVGVVEGYHFLSYFLCPL